ncbi:MAG: alpha/beta hydrolase [Coriobacteriia bacterium]|nr:alpha/beta hydrolase [Coriobacteriia bacterium]
MTKNYTEEFVSINGISQYFLHLPRDSKNVLLMLHGGPGIPNSFAAYFHQPYLDFCNAVYYDQRGAGKTQQKNKTKPEDLSMDVLVEDLRQTVQYVKEKYETDRIFLAGHSAGSMLGTEYIIKYPNDVAGYIGYGQMVDSEAAEKSWFPHLKAAVLKSGKKSDIKKVNSVSTDFPDLPRDEYVKATVLLTGLEFKYSFKVNEVTQIYRKSPIMTFKDAIQMVQMNTGGKISQKLLGDVIYGCDFRDVTEYQVPIYYILGRYDEWTPSTIVAEYFEAITAPKKGLYWIEDAGHMVDTDNPEAFFEAVKEILTDS